MTRRLVKAVLLATSLWPGIAGQDNGGDGCFTNFTAIGAIEDFADVQQVREYIICPNSTLQIGFVNNNGQIEGELPLAIRANMRVLCGEDGSINNNCTLLGGSFAFVGFVELFGFEYLHNVFISGFTLKNFFIYGASLFLPGTVTIFDCVFQDMGNLPGLSEWFPEDHFEEVEESKRRLEVDRSAHMWKRRSLMQEEGRSLQEFSPVFREPTPDDFVELTYENCVFQNNFGTELLDFRGIPAVVTSLGQTRTILKECSFLNNTYTNDKGAFDVGVIVLQDDGELLLQDVCFEDNEFESPAPVVVLFGSGARTDTQVTPLGDSECGLMARYDRVIEGENLFEIPITSCLEPDSDETCEFLASGANLIPTASPAPSTSAAPSYSPSVSQVPTATPTSPMPTTATTPDPTTDSTSPPSGAVGNMSLSVAAAVATIVATCLVGM